MPVNVMIFCATKRRNITDKFYWRQSQSFNCIYYIHIYNRQTFTTSAVWEKLQSRLRLWTATVRSCDIILFDGTNFHNCVAMQFEWQIHVNNKKRRKRNRTFINNILVIGEVLRSGKYLHVDLCGTASTLVNRLFIEDTTKQNIIDVCYVR